MKKFLNYLVLFFLLFLFILMFKYNGLIKLSVIESCKLWFFSLVPSLLPLYIIVDLLLNYGLGDLLYKVFKKNSIILVLISLLTGSPSNAKYIKEFYNNGLISKSAGNFLLLFSYSPNPFFVLGVSPTTDIALKTLLYIYITNIMIALIFKKHFDFNEENSATFKKVSFSLCIENSIHKSFNILTLILGIVTIYGILNNLIRLVGVNYILLNSMLELTNAVDLILKSDVNIYWMIFASAFGGLSIHTQIKSILEGSELSYRYFLIGRFIALLPILLFLCFN